MFVFPLISFNVVNIYNIDKSFPVNIYSYGGGKVRSLKNTLLESTIVNCDIV